MANDHHDASERRTWIWVTFLVVLILAKGLFAFSVVSDLGPPTWSYRPVQDLPASSPYANYPPLPYPQHIRGGQGE
jgi:hypothetical protein